MARRIGRVASERLGSGRLRWFVDFRNIEGVGRVRIYSVPGVGRIKDRQMAEEVLDHVQGELRRGKSLVEVVTLYSPPESKPAQVQIKLNAWLEIMRRRVEAGDRSPGYLRELTRYCKPDGHFSWWTGRSIYEVDYASLEDWGYWLADRGLSAKTRRNVMGAFRAFLGWLCRRGFGGA